MKAISLLAGLVAVALAHSATAQQPMHRIIVDLAIEIPMDAASEEVEQERKKQIHEAQLQLLGELPQGTYRLKYLYESTPQLALSVDDWALNYLKTSSKVKTVHDDKVLSIPRGKEGHPAPSSQR